MRDTDSKPERLWPLSTRIEKCIGVGLEASVKAKDVQRIFTNAPWESKVGYCRAIRMGNIIAVTGTVSLNNDGKVYAANDPYHQAKRCLEIIEQAIRPLGADRTNIIRTRMFVTEIKL